MTNNINLRENIPLNIVKWAKLESTANALFKNFESWKERNAELINKFFEQSYFSWEESLINKFSEIQPDLDFDYIKDEWINLAILENNDWMRDFKKHLDKINSNNFKKSFIEAIYEKLNNKIWWSAPYSSDFSSECDISHFTTPTPNVPSYFQKIISYLKWKESAKGWKKTPEILKDIIITNEDINNKLSTTWENIPSWIPLNNTSISAETRNAFDTLLSFEIGKEADRTINISQNIAKELETLFTNSLPAINTIIWENDNLKFDETQLWEDYILRLQAIRNDTNLSEKEKNKQENDLKREFYLWYVKTKNKTIGNVLEELYNNNFDYSKIETSLLESYLDKITDIRLNMLINKWLNSAFKLDIWDINDFENYYKWLAKCSINTITLDPFRWISLPVEKKIDEWEHIWLKDINEFWKTAKSYDTLPITYKIKKSDIDSLPIDIEDRTKLLIFLSRFTTDNENYIISWWDVWMLIYLFFVINSKTPITNFDPDKQKEVEQLFWQAKEHEEKWWEEDKEWKDNSEDNSWKEKVWEEKIWEDNNSEEDNLEKNAEWSNNLSPEEFVEKIEKYWSNTKFENWSEIRLPMGKSELPGWWYWWMKIKISDVNMKKWTFKWTVFWWELKFNNKVEWKSRTFEMNQEFFKGLNNITENASAGTDKIRLLPNPDNINFNSFRSRLNNKLWTSTFSFPATWTTWDGSKFMQKNVDDNWKEKDVEVKYFWASSDDKSTYKIEYNPIRKSFTVSSTFNWEGKNKKWETEKKRFSYKRDMDWNNFLIFFTQKWLYPQTEEEAKDAIQRQDNEFKMVNGWKWKLNWFSLINIKNVFKTIKWNINKKIEAYNKAQDEKLEDILIWDWWLYNTLAWVLWFIPSMKNGLWELQQEYYNDRDNRTWKKIEYYLKIFQSDPDFWTTFEEVPPFARLFWWKSYKQFITDLAAPNSSRSKDDIHKAAALLLANIEKWASPYRWLAGEENSGLWVKALLGQAHYKQFMRDKQKCIHDLENAWKEQDQIQDVLATCEMDYIINNVSWSNWKLGYFGCHEDRWIPGKEGTKYIDNPSKRLLSNQFADKLKWAYKWRFNKSSVEESFGKITHNDFNLAKEDFKRLIKSSRFPWAIANLKKMFLLAKTPEQKSEYQKYFLLYMLSGVLDVNGKKDLRKTTYQRAKTMSFLPGMLAKETCHSQKVVTLLDDFCQEKWYWKFSESVKSYFHEWDLKNWKLQIENLIKDLDSWWNINIMEDFEEYSKSIFPSKIFPENSILKKLQTDVLDSGMENIDNSLLDNPVVANSWWLLSNANVVRDRMAIKDGVFDWKDPEERDNRAKFWEQIANEVENMHPDSPESVNLVLNQYFSRFGLNSEADRQKAYKRITTAYYWKDKIGEEFTYDYNGKWQYLDMWTISGEEIKDILWYTFYWTVRKDCFSSRKLPTQMENALKNFQTFFYKAFETWTLNHPTVIKKAFKAEWTNTEPMLLWSRDLYKEVFVGDWEMEYDNTEIWEEKDAFKDPKKRRKAQKRAFKSWRFINNELAQIEKSFKNRFPPGSYRTITQDTSSDIETRIRWKKRELNREDELPLAA